MRDALANLLAINYERVRALDRAATAEVARRNEEFKRPRGASHGSSDGWRG